MMSVTPESVESAFCMQIAGVFFLYFLNKLPFCLHSYFIFIFLFEAKCLQIDSNFIANNLRETNGFETFSISHNFFNYNWLPSWMPSNSWIYRNSQ